MQQNNPNVIHDHPDYELHVPRALTYPVYVSFLWLLFITLLVFLFDERLWVVILLSGLSLLPAGAYVGLSLLLRWFTNLEHRLKVRDRLLREIPWTGDEAILDVGCGNGILLMEAAKRLTTGTGIGIDIWTENSGDSRPEAFRENAILEGVADRVTLQNEDVRNLPYNNNSFDLIISGLTMHHISRGADTSKAVSEIIRVLRPGGRIAIVDEPFTVYLWARLLRKNNLELVRKEKELVIGVKTTA